jgi:cytochrome b561
MAAFFFAKRERAGRKERKKMTLTPAGTRRHWFNTRLSYGIIAKLLHWILALLIIGLLASGNFSDTLAREDPLKGEIIGVHKIVGTIALLLMAFRLLWWLINSGVEALESTTGMQRFLARLVHIGLYLAVFTQALSGAAMTQIAGYPAEIFGWSLPAIFGPGALLDVPGIFANLKELGMFCRSVHSIAGKVLLALVGLHIVAGLYHHFGVRDETMRRMWF